MPNATQKSPSSQQNRNNKRAPEHHDLAQEGREQETPVINVGRNERIASLAMGGLLTYVGFKRHSTLGAFLMLIGGSMIQRGYTGYCGLNTLLDRDTTQPGESQHLLGRRCS